MKEIILQIYNRNKEGESLKKLREEFNITEGQFRHGRNRLNLPALNKKNRILIKEDIFDNIDNEFKAYYLGLIASDGCIFKEGNSWCISISLIQTDSYILKLFKDIVIPDRKLYINRNQKVITIRSKKLGDRLIDLGIKPRKSIEPGLNIPNINSNLIRHFIRGYFDGDGHICLSRRSSAKMGFLCKFPDILKNIKKEIENNLPEFKITLYKDNYERWYLETSSQCGVLLLGAWLYKDANYYLIRKFNKWNIIANKYLQQEIKAQPYGYANPVLNNFLKEVVSVESRN